MSDKPIHKVRRGTLATTHKDAKFTDDGDEIERTDQFTLLDRYLATEPGSDHMRRELDALLRARR